MRYRDPFRIFPKKMPSGKTVYYYTVYDEWNRRRQYSTGQSSKSAARHYCMKQFKTDTLLPTGRISFSAFTENSFIYDKCSYIQGRLMRGYSRNSINHILSILRVVFSEAVRTGHSSQEMTDNYTTLTPKQMQLSAVKNGLSHISIEEIEAEISASRKDR